MENPVIAIPICSFFVCGRSGRRLVLYEKGAYDRYVSLACCHNFMTFSEILKVGGTYLHKSKADDEDTGRTDALDEPGNTHLPITIRDHEK